MSQPKVTRRTVTALRRLLDEAALRTVVCERSGLHHSGLSRVLRDCRDDGQAVEPDVGLLELVLREAARDVEGSGHRSLREELLSAVAGEPVSLCVPAAPSGPRPPATPADVERDLLSVVQELGALAAAGASALADRRVDPEEAETTIRQALDARLAIDNYVRALQDAAHRG